MGVVQDKFSDRATEIEEKTVGSVKTTYVGISIDIVGGKDKSRWWIKRIVEDSTVAGTVSTQIRNANDEATYNKIWDDRATYSYNA